MGKLMKSMIGLGIILIILFALSIDYAPPERLNYGVSFSRFHSDELGLDWKETYLAILNDLKVRRFRFSAHWPSVESQKDKYNFEELDFQIKEAQKVGASVVLAVGRRLPGWPECHEPGWASSLSESEKQERILKLIKTVVERYKSYDNIIYWQIENEPYLGFFADFICGNLDEGFLRKEVQYAKELDPSRPILVTDSGEFGKWYQAYSRGDVFGTSMYLYIWNRKIGPFRYPITPAFFRIKHNLVKIFFGEKPAIVIELSGEPWLLQPIKDTPVDVQLQRMGIDKLNEMITFSSKTGFDTFYLWGAEWWYWLKINGHSDEHWNKAIEIFSL
jgi:hypothetical protein